MRTIAQEADRPVEVCAGFNAPRAAGVAMILAVSLAVCWPLAKLGYNGWTELAARVQCEAIAWWAAERYGTPPYEMTHSYLLPRRDAYCVIFHEPHSYDYFEASIHWRRESRRWELSAAMHDGKRVDLGEMGSH
jgi:hypothetical protein